MKYKEYQRDICMSCGHKAPDGAIHQCYAQSRLHHADIPGSVIDDKTDDSWIKLILPLNYETTKKEKI